MTKKQRSFLFVLMVLVFLVTGPSIVLYSQGYRIDFEKMQIVQTGAFYFRVTPRNVEIEISSLDNKKIGSFSTGFFFGTSYVENLIPKKYNIEISKENYHDWKKTLEIKEKRATEIKNVTLIPKDPEFDFLIDEINDLFHLPESNLLIVEKQQENNWILLKKNGTSKESSELFSSNPREKLLNIKELNKLNKILIETKERELINRYILNTQKENEIVEINLPKNAKTILFHPEEKETVIFMENNEIFSYNYETRNKSSFLKKVIAYSFNFHNDFFWLSDNGFLMNGFEDPKKVNRIPLEIKDGKKYNVVFLNFSEKLIKENNDFYLLDSESLKFKKAFKSEYSPIASPNLNKLFYSNGHEINILFLENIDDQPQRSYLDKVFLTRFSEKIENADWFTSHYLLFTVSDTIKVIEIDNRDNINLINLAKLKEPKLCFDSRNKKLYVLSEEKLFVSSELLP